MAARVPLVIIGGIRQRLPAGDTVVGGPSSTPTHILAGETVTIPARAQVLYKVIPRVHGILRCLGILARS